MSKLTLEIVEILAKRPAGCRGPNNGLLEIPFPPSARVRILAKQLVNTMRENERLLCAIKTIQKACLVNNVSLALRETERVIAEFGKNDCKG